MAVIAGETDAAERKKKFTDIVKAAGNASESQIEQQYAQIDSPWFRRFLTLDPAVAIEKVRCPVLAMAGTNDTQVDAEQNLPAVAAALKKAGNKDVTIEKLPGLNHLFQESKTGAPGEYAQIEQTMSPKALETMASWITKRSGTAK
jgi:fermentation-respiration switch protein FrsA (DUF1100 family)